MMMHPDDYAKKVLSGEIPACKYVKQAIQRHQKDLERNDIVFNPEIGMYAVKFFGFLQHTKGQWAGQPFELLGWQSWIIYVLFGWHRADGFRRFRQAYVEIPRKNGKSTLAGGLATYMYVGDGEEGPEVYTGATTTKQARIVFDEARAMILKNKTLRQSLKVYQHDIRKIHDPVAKFQPTSREADNLDGLNPSCAIIDEYHAHKTDDVYNVFKSALGARQQPLQFTITTAGFNKGGPCYQMRKTCIDILEGKKQDDSQFCIIFTIDDDDDWTDPKAWAKANPSIGEALNPEYLNDEYIQAVNNPSQQVNFKTKHLNLWTDSSTTWIDSRDWNACAAELNLDDHEGEDAWLGIDLSNTRDVTALAVIVPQSNGKIFFYKRFYIPEDTIMMRSKADGVAYDYYVKQGFMTATPGNVVDYDYIKRDVLEISTKLNIRSLAYDRWNATQIMSQLAEHEVNVVAYSQTFGHLSHPTKELEKLVISGNIIHEGCEAMEWMIGNVELDVDANGNVKPNKRKSQEKIDGVAALVMAIGQWIKDESEEENTMYEDTGIWSL